ncbi:proline-rich transmembrane protein 1-like [Physella acuta]|uniref:proline-rich transmembrane protein 1-like n=1 Tax=Physella acuta TaxID=109671 RepID=UPI0027DD85D9|nr:proline-rich transmembrane protein 1-like [Physella acuta]
MEKSAQEKAQLSNDNDPPPVYSETPMGGAPYSNDGAPYPSEGGAQYPPQKGALYPPQGGSLYPPQGGTVYLPQGGSQYPLQAYPAGGTTYPNYPYIPVGVQQGPSQQTSNTVVVVMPTANEPAKNTVVTVPVPPDQMCAAIFVTLCCFWPTGIVAILRASNARTALAQGDLTSAQVYSRTARSMVIISVVLGIITYILIIIITSAS